MFKIGKVRQKREKGVIELKKWGDVVVRWSLMSKMRSAHKSERQIFDMYLTSYLGVGTKVGSSHI